MLTVRVSGASGAAGKIDLMLATLPAMIKENIRCARLPLLPLIAAAIGLSTAVMAGDDNHGRLNVPAADWKSAAEIKDKLVSAGYTVREIETDDGAYEVDVVDKDGVRNGVPYSSGNGRNPAWL